jgi:uncharacterized damage-inducible protein DinB
VLAELFDSGVIDYRVDPKPDSMDAVVETFERGARATVERARTANDEVWNGPAKFLYDGKVAWETTASDMAWGFLFDMVHHRGQLTAYLRPMGGKVPSIYGPSGDERLA